MRFAYEETSVSRTARARITSDVERGVLDRRLLELDFDSPKRKRYTNSDGILDIAKVYTSLGTSYRLGELLIRAVELNLTEMEVRAVIERRYHDVYDGFLQNPELRTAASITYPQWCELFGIEPSKDFSV